MFNRLLFGLLIMAFGSTLLAQEKGSGVSLSQAAGTAGDFVSVEYGDWELLCGKQSGSPCVMAQIGKDTKGTPILEMRIRKLPEEREVEGKKIVAIADILTPLGVMLLKGIELQIDLGPVYGANYQLCVETGCIVREPLANDTISALKSGGKAVISLVAASMGEVRATISLKGFTKAYNAMR